MHLIRIIHGAEGIWGRIYRDMVRDQSKGQMETRQIETKVKQEKKFYFLAKKIRMGVVQ
jgi:hypothetical protein